jgi:N-acetylmuramoyl-L-alanine amidase
MKPFVEPPRSTTDWVQHVRQAKNEMEQISMNNAEIDFKQRVVPFSDESKSLLERLAYDLVDQQNKLEKEGLEVLLSRTREKSMRLALICALADDRNAKQINADVTRWAIDYVNYYDQVLIENCRDKVAGSEMEGRIKQILNFIRSQGDWGISKRDIDRREIFRSMKSYEVKEIIERLKNSGEIQEKDMRAKGTGRPTKRIVAIDPEFFDED